MEKPPSDWSSHILQYLRAQENYDSDADREEEWGRTNSALLRAKSFLDELIDDIDKRALLLADHERILRAHNQYPLFDLSTKISLFNVDDEMYKKLTFREILVIGMLRETSGIPQFTGGLCLDVQLAKGGNPLLRKFSEWNKVSNVQDDIQQGETPSEQGLLDFKKATDKRNEHTYTKFLVHLSSSFSIDERNAGSKITAWIDKNLHTLEEKREEYCTQENDLLVEKKLYCALQPKKYYVRHTSLHDNLEDKKYYDLVRSKNYVGEGANFVLMRYLAISKFVGTFELESMYINGDLCRNIYECTGPESGFVNGEKLDLCKIRRTIIEECQIIHKCITVLTLSGKLIKQEWEGCDYILLINPSAKVTNDTPTLGENLSLKKTWKSDAQLFSNFLDYKTTRLMQMKSYLSEHSELKRMMADYVQTTILMKPDEILDFTINYFTKFYFKEPVIADEYHEEECYETFQEDVS